MEQRSLFKRFSDDDIQVITAFLILAQENGHWLGQVELEEHFDRQDFARAGAEAMYSRKTAMPLNHKQTSTQSHKVEVCLRSKEWRDGVKISCSQNLEKIINMLKEV